MGRWQNLLTKKVVIAGWILASQARLGNKWFLGYARTIIQYQTIYLSK